MNLFILNSRVDEKTPEPTDFALYNLQISEDSS